jgi:hypothetical protein
MEKKIESIISINCYLANNKNNIKKTELVRGYLTSKVNSMLSSSRSENNFLNKVLNIPLVLLSL